MIDYSKLKSALVNLDRQWANLQQIKDSEAISELDVEAMQESVIKRFDIAMEMTWKHLMKYLTEEVGINETPNGQKPILRLADQNGLLDTRIGEWIEYVNARNASSHDCSGEKAEQTLAVIPGFIADAKGLYERMSKEPWEQAV